MTNTGLARTICTPMPRLPDSLRPSRSDRLRIGDCFIDLPLREVRAPGMRRAARITPKSMGVLLVLVENAGRVVARDALLADVWPDTMPTNDVVTQAITQLRKAFGEGRDKPRYIETIAKGGYRLLAEVEWLSAEDAVGAPGLAVPPAASDDASGISAFRPPAPAQAGSPGVPRQPATLPAARNGRRWGWGLALGALMLVLIAGGAWLGTQRTAQRAARIDNSRPLLPESRPYRLLTSEPGFELSPSLSPDGSQVAYLASDSEEIVGTAIMVQTTEPAQPRRLTYPPAGTWDSNPEWSPSGREIAFLRRFPGADCRIMAVAASGGEPRVLADCDPNNRPSFDWTPDGNGLIFSSALGGGEHGLRLLDLATGQWRALEYGASAENVDTAPRYSPDGTWIAFVRNTPLGDLWRIPAAGGRPERLTHQRAEFRGWDWAPDSRSIVFGRRVDAHTRLYRLDLEDRSLRDLGIEDAQAPAVAAKTGQIAFVQRKPQFGIYRVSSEGATVLPSEHLFASTGRDTLPSIAPDGRQLIFTSDRSGEYAFWWADLERPRSLRPIEGIRPESRHLPVWSPDSRQLLVIGTAAGGRYGLHEVNAANGQLRWLPVPVPADELLFAAYMPEQNRLLVVAGKDDGQQLILFDRSTVPWRRLAVINGVSFARPDPARNRVLFTRIARDGLWQADLRLSAASIRQIDASRPASQRYRTWTVTEDGQVDYLEQLPGCYVSLRHIGTGRSHPEPRCVEPNHLATVNGFSAHARTRTAYIAMAINDGSDIGLLPAPAPAPDTSEASR